MARFDLGVPEEEVGRLTLLEFDALLKRKKTSDNRQRFNAGIIAAAICNTAPFGDPDRKALTPLDFVPDWKRELPAQGVTDSNGMADLTKMTPIEQKDFMLGLFGLKGKV